jgi:hypothetical protein
MKEEFLHYIFRNRLWSDDDLFLTDGRKLEIIDVGLQNYDAGPDFFNSKIKIENTIWAGNVELHINSSDWYKHKHQNDLSYSNVILHVVYNHDKPVFISGENEIPVWEIKFPHVLFNKYSELKNNEKQIPCEEYFDMVDKLKLGFWLERMALERLEYKSEVIDKYLTISRNDWEFAFYVSLCRSFGSGLNSDPFEQLAINTDLKLIRKYADNLIKLESLIFGQSGLLDIAIKDDYVNLLQREYSFLRKLHNLTPVLAGIWKFSKMRPANLPHIKLAQLTSVLSGFHGLFTSVISNVNYKEVKNLLNVSVSEYWESHYVFGKPVEKTLSGFGKSAIDTFIINTIAPFVYRYYKDYQELENDVKHYTILSNIKPENNRVTRVWRNVGLEADDAFGSQALIHLKTNYCDLRKCLRCGIGINIMQQIGDL